MQKSLSFCCHQAFLCPFSEQEMQASTALVIPTLARYVILFPLHFNKFSKTLLTNSAYSGIFLVNPTVLVDCSKIIHKMWSCSFWTQPQEAVGSHCDNHHFQQMIAQKERTAPQHTRSFCRRFTPTKSFACTAWAVFFFFTNKILCSYTNLRKSFWVVDCTTSKCYYCVWKKQDVVSALRPAFFIPNLESFISRLNVISCHDLTLSVGEPDNAAAKQGQELRSG